MRLIEQHELDAVAGANTQRELFDFIQRVLRDMERAATQEPITW